MDLMQEYECSDGASGFTLPDHPPADITAC